MIGAGDVSNTEHAYLNSVTSNVQTQINGAGLTSKQGLFTRDMSTASGSVAYTGVGFQPTSIIFFSSYGSAGYASWGVVDSSLNGACTSDYTNVTTDSYEYFGDEIRVNSTHPNRYKGYVSSYDTDGFTIQWTKDNTMSGTLKVIYLAYK